MRNTILQSLVTGLKSSVGTGSSYTSLKVEDIQSRIPDITGTNSFIGIEIDGNAPISAEIGGFIPTIYEYTCTIATLLKNADYQNGQEQLDTITRRILKYLNGGSINGLTATNDGMTESVQGYSVENITYTGGQLKMGELGHISIITLKIKTDLNFN